MDTAEQHGSTPRKTVGTNPLASLDPVPDYFRPARPNVLVNLYWWFATERQRILFARIEKSPPPWTTDPILQKYRFTNAYRVSDRTSQYLVRHVIYGGPQDRENLFFRTILFKLFNSVRTWEALESAVGPIEWSEITVSGIQHELDRIQRCGEPIYSAAYIMPPAPAGYGQLARKHAYHLYLLALMMRDEVPRSVAAAKSMIEVFQTLSAYPGIGDFLAYQYSIDLNYSTLTDFSENDYVVPGPGARRGIRKCFDDLGGYDEADIIRIMTENQAPELARCGLERISLAGRKLHLIDCQNLFCEVDKYTRVSHPQAVEGVKGTRIKRTFAPGPWELSLWFPPKWGLQPSGARE
jgi:5-hmdU DNA kinase, helical domain